MPVLRGALAHVVSSAEDEWTSWEEMEDIADWVAHAAAVSNHLA